jgi:hypothetical protein
MVDVCERCKMWHTTRTGQQYQRAIVIFMDIFNTYLLARANGHREHSSFGRTEGDSATNTQERAVVYGSNVVDRRGGNSGKALAKGKSHLKCGGTRMWSRDADVTQTCRLHPRSSYDCSQLLCCTFIGYRSRRNSEAMLRQSCVEYSAKGESEITVCPMSS